MFPTKYGWKPDLPDVRDFSYEPTYKVTKLPKSIDLRQSKNLSPVEDQGDLGSCTANAIVGCLEYLENKKKVSFKDLSRLFLYYNERVLEGTVNQDSGAYIRDGIKCLVKFGICSEFQWSYVVAEFATHPFMACYVNALKSKISSYCRLNSLTDMKTCLAEGYPFVFGFTVYDSFESQEVAETGILFLPGKNERPCGGHAVCAVGYDDSIKRFIIRNSWGSSWGQDGYFTMPYDYLSNRNLSDDFWTIKA